MHKTILSLVIIAASPVFFYSCKSTSKTAGKTTAPMIIDSIAPVVFKSINDSASYAIGVSMASFYKQQGIPQLNTALVAQAIHDIYGNKKPIFDDDLANNLMNRYMMKLQEEKSMPNIKAGEEFLAKNKLRPEVKTTASGLQYEIIRDTAGPKPTLADTIVAHYKGSFINGVEFENSYSRGQPLTIAVRQLITGWTEGLLLMNKGSKYKFFIPYALGYGAFDHGPMPGGIPGGSTLIFELELLDIKRSN